MAEVSVSQIAHIRESLRWLEEDAHSVDYVEAENYAADVTFLLGTLDAITHAYHAYNTSPTRIAITNAQPGQIRTRLMPTVRAEALDALLALLGQLESGDLYQALVAFSALAKPGA